MPRSLIISLCFFISFLVGCEALAPLPLVTPTAAVIVTTATSTPFPTIAPSSTPTPLLARPTNAPTTMPLAQPIISLPIPTDTTAPPPPEPTTTVQLSILCGAAACVKSDAESLRLRAAPDLEAEILGVLDAGAALTVEGRNEDQTWLYVTTSEQRSGWVSASYIDTTLRIDALPLIVSSDSSVSSQSVAGIAPHVSGISEMTRSIYTRGQSLGNRPNVFSKVGDSLTVATWVMYPLGWGQQQLGAYSQLQPTIAYFSSITARDNNSFANTSLTADNGWTTAHVLNVNGANPTICQSGESPLECEYRLVRPSIAIILLGTNDVADLSLDEYRFNMQRIIEISIARGVIPVLTTLPPRLGYEGQIDEMNTSLASLSQQFGVPLLDYAAAMREAPNNGLSADGVHPSWPPGEGNWASAVDFRGPNLGYGYTLRNLTVLYALDALRTQIIGS